MSLYELILLSIALAMDCFTVSVASGFLLRSSQRTPWLVVVWLSFLFGLFQALMPLVGWLLTNHFAHYIADYDHWVAFGMLTFIGGRMVADAFRPSDRPATFNPRHLTTQLLLAVATSIDALAVGISFAATGYAHLASLLVPLLLIGVASLGFGLLGHWLGLRFGNMVSRRLRPELVGGVILILIGFKILAEHLL